MRTSLLSVQIGGAFAPPLKDLCRFLQENPEYGIPPEWADVVKQSVRMNRQTGPSKGRKSNDAELRNTVKAT